MICRGPIALAIGLTWGLFPIELVGTQVRADEVDEHVQAEMRDHQIPGAALAVVQNGKTIKVQGYGLASIELNVPVSPNSVFDIASMTKPITATAALMLVDDGRLRLEDRIGQFLPDIPAAWSNVTIRHLLSHTGGFAGLENSFHG